MNPQVATPYGNQPFQKDPMSPMPGMPLSNTEPNMNYPVKSNVNRNYNENATNGEEISNRMSNLNVNGSNGSNLDLDNSNAVNSNQYQQPQAPPNQFNNTFGPPIVAESNANVKPNNFPPGYQPQMYQQQHPPSNATTQPGIVSTSIPPAMHQQKPLMSQPQSQMPGPAINARQGPQMMPAGPQMTANSGYSNAQSPKYSYPDNTQTTNRLGPASQPGLMQQQQQPSGIAANLSQPPISSHVTSGPTLTSPMKPLQPLPAGSYSGQPAAQNYGQFAQQTNQHLGQPQGQLPPHPGLHSRPVGPSGPLSGQPAPLSGPSGPLSGPPGPLSGTQGAISGPPGSHLGSPSFGGPPGQTPGSMPGQLPGSMQMSGPHGGPLPGQLPPNAVPQHPGQHGGQHLGQYPGQYPGQMGSHSGPQHPQHPGQMGQMGGHPGQYPGQQGGYPQPMGYPNEYQPQSQPRRLDPEHMPSPIQVTQDDETHRSGVFVTNQRGQVPPLVTTRFIVQDQGNASPRFIRSSIYNVPITQDLLKQTNLPFSLVISPFARLVDDEYPPPLVDFGEMGPVRCVRCKVYMCPYMQFIDSGKRFQCLFCKATTEVPGEYFQHLDHTGQRIDRYERPELVLGAYEFVATKEYCSKNQFPKTPAVVFVIDVSYNNVKSGLVSMLCAEMKRILRNLPVDQVLGQTRSTMKVGFITYNKTVHFYNIKGNLAQPQVLLVGDVQDIFMPLLDGFLCDVEESEAIIDSLMEQIPKMFGDTRETETVLAPAIQAGLEALKAADCAGKLYVFHSSLPIAEAPGKLKNREDRKLLGTDKEKTVLMPQTNVYNELGQSCVLAGCSVDLFILNNSYVDLATIGQVARLSGGQVYKYTYFQADIDGFRLINDLIDNLKRPIAFDAVMRVRTSAGVRPTDFYGHMFMSNTSDMELASIDSEKAIAIEIKHDDKLAEDDGVYIQAALLYTSCSGQRRLRIINLSLKTCAQFADLYKHCDLDTIMNYYLKQYTFKLRDASPKAIKENLVQRCAQTLASYRKHCSPPSSAGQLILPECMKLMPLYLNCLLKCDALSGGPDITLDERSFMMYRVMTMDVYTSATHLYPRLMPVHTLDVNANTIPNPVRCSYDKLSDTGAFILENGIHMFLWLGLNLPSGYVQNIFGASSMMQVNTDVSRLPELNNPMSTRLRGLIDQLRSQKHCCMRLTLVRQNDKLESVFKQFLVEDRGMDGSSSYVDFLCHMHKEIRALLS